MYWSMRNDFFCGGYESSTPLRRTMGRSGLLGGGTDVAEVKKAMRPGISCPQVSYTALARVAKYFWAVITPTKSSVFLELCTDSPGSVIPILFRASSSAVPRKPYSGFAGKGHDPRGPEQVPFALPLPIRFESPVPIREVTTIHVVKPTSKPRVVCIPRRLLAPDSMATGTATGCLRGGKRRRDDVTVSIFVTGWHRSCDLLWQSLQ